MQTRYQTDHDLQDLHGTTGQDREISLGTTTILGIFFALALICAVFFGFGYSMGRRSVQGAINASEPPARTDGNGSLKPAPGSLAESAGKQSAAATQSAIVPTEAADTAAPDTQPVPVDAPKSVAGPHPDANPQTPSVSPAKPAAIPVSSSAPSAGSLVVQVAAMSHQEDADVVAVDLKRRGYTVAIRHEPQDKLFHVQIGSFSTKKDADSMRLRLQTDGYNNAIVK